jgi:hypothetical protein
MSRILYKSALFMQNKPNFRKAKMNTTLFSTKDYDNKHIFILDEKQTQSNPISTPPHVLIDPLALKNPSNPPLPSYPGPLPSLTVLERNFPVQRPLSGTWGTLPKALSNTNVISARDRSSSPQYFGIITASTESVLPGCRSK